MITAAAPPTPTMHTAHMYWGTEGGGGEGGRGMHQAEAVVQAAAAAAAAPATVSPPCSPSPALGLPFPRRGPGGRWMAGKA